VDLLPGGKGQIWQWNWFGSVWKNAQATTLAAEPGTSPTALAYGGTPGNPYQVVYYHGSEDRINQWFWDGAKPSNGSLPVIGKKIADKTSPAALASGGTPGNPNQWVYYQGEGGQIWQWSWFGKEWKNAQATTEAAAAGTSPTVISSGGAVNNPRQWVYYIGIDGQIRQWEWNTTSGLNTVLGGGKGQPAATDTNPTAIAYGAANFPYRVVYYKGTDGKIWQWFWDGFNWKNGELKAAP